MKRVREGAHGAELDLQTSFGPGVWRLESRPQYIDGLWAESRQRGGASMRRRAARVC